MLIVLLFVVCLSRAEAEGGALSTGATVLAIGAVVALSALLVRAFKHSQAHTYDSIS